MTVFQKVLKSTNCAPLLRVRVQLLSFRAGSVAKAGSVVSRLAATTAVYTGIVIVLSLWTVVYGQAMTVPEMLDQQEKWSQWAQDSTQLQIEGRYEGRAAQNFRLARLPITFLPPRNNPLPEKMQLGQRIDVTGRLRTMSGRMQFEVNRLAVGETDIERLQHRVRLLPSDRVDEVYSLAEEYQRVAEFYSDSLLMIEVETVRLNAFRHEVSLHRMKAEMLWKLAAKAESLKLESRIVAAVRFESLVARWKADERDLPQLITLMEQHLPGWDQSGALWDERRERNFASSPVTAYEQASDPERLLLHRRLYRAVQQDRLSRMLKSDGSNGLSIAAEMRELIPEEQTLIKSCELAEVDYRLSRVKRLTRQELQELTDLLTAHDRSKEINRTVDVWVREQETRFVATGLAGITRAADEYLFVGERWNRDEHRQKGVDLLKQAWQIASRESAADAVQIADRLKRLGWEFLKDQWMTTQQIRALPDDDVQLAMREGRVVQGMLQEHVAGTLGQPTRISRLVSARLVRELWIYDSQGSAGVIVQFQRNPREPAKLARVSDISPLPSR